MKWRTKEKLRLLVTAMTIACAPLSHAGAQSVMDGSDAHLDEGAAETAMRAVLRYLTDPSSAQFYSLGYAKQSDGSSDKEMICGYVNARNQLGGYTGIEPFFINRATGGEAMLLPSELRSNPKAMPAFIRFVEALGCQRPF